MTSKTYYQSLLIIGAVLTAGNFVYQLIGNQHWGVAIERSYFQIIAIAVVATFDMMTRKR